MGRTRSPGPRLTVALTGGIGSGKTRVSDRFGGLGAAVIDADVIARELTAPGETAPLAIADAFGPHVITAEGALDRALLRSMVFADPSARRRLENILHPLIRARMGEQLSRVAATYALLVIPLLFETGQERVADRILVVDAPEAVQIARVRERSGMEEEEIRRILGSQASRQVRLAGADDLIDNSGSLSHLFAQVDRLHRRYLELAGAEDR